MNYPLGNEFKKAREEMGKTDPLPPAVREGEKSVGPHEFKEVPDPVTQAKRHVAKMANAFCLCMEGVDKLVAPNTPQTSANSDFFERVAMAFFIELKQMRLVDKLPVKPAKFWEPPPKHTLD